MTTVFHTTAEELDESFLASVKAVFNGLPIEIAVSEADATTYLLRHPASRDRLLVADVESGRNVITPEGPCSIDLVLPFNRKHLTPFSAVELVTQRLTGWFCVRNGSNITQSLR